MSDCPAYAPNRACKYGATPGCLSIANYQKWWNSGVKCICTTPKKCIFGKGCGNDYDCCKKNHCRIGINRCVPRN